VSQTRWQVAAQDQAARDAAARVVAARAAAEVEHPNPRLRDLPKPVVPDGKDVQKARTTMVAAERRATALAAELRQMEDDVIGAQGVELSRGLDALADAEVRRNAAAVDAAEAAVEYHGLLVQSYERARAEYRPVVDQLVAELAEGTGFGAFAAMGPVRDLETVVEVAAGHLAAVGRQAVAARKARQKALWRLGRADEYEAPMASPGPAVAAPKAAEVPMARAPGDEPAPPVVVLEKPAGAAPGEVPMAEPPVPGRLGAGRVGA
jgi:hypothetical protein